ncbi:MAG TPA: DNA-3-methyladenine glycosylase [Acidimicrobiales bacterium]|nr:DNA-3-methyladenine glycosylase [Acidimicrobiales bacterium]
MTGTAGGAPAANGRGGRARRPRVLPRSFYDRGALEVAPDLLGKVLQAGRRRGRIVEVEAYRGGEDQASHAFRGPSRRNATMFGPPGHLYVYFTYGMHWCANAVCLPEGRAEAVLIRALAPVAGIEAMRAHRPAATTDRDLCRGPARLCQALGITGSHDGADLVTGDLGVRIVDDGVPPAGPVARGPRVGIRVAAEHPWRFWVEGDRHVSPGPRGV